MSREFPDFVDPWKAADGERTFGGTMPLARLKRLTPLLAGPAGDDGGVAEFTARFRRDREGLVTIELDVSASLPLVCQRSMEPYIESVDRHSLLAVISEPDEEDLLPGHYEPVLAENGRLALAELVEDELLLGLPEVPRNPAVAEVRISTGSADSVAAPAEQRRHRPFEALADLMTADADRDPEKDPGKTSG